MNSVSALSSTGSGGAPSNPMAMSVEAVKATPGKEEQSTSTMSCALWRKRRSGSFSSRSWKEAKKASGSTARCTSTSRSSRQSGLSAS